MRDGVLCCLYCLLISYGSCGIILFGKNEIILSNLVQHSQLPRLGIMYFLNIGGERSLAKDNGRNAPMLTELEHKLDEALEKEIIGDISFTDEELDEIQKKLQRKYDEKLRYGMNPLEMLKINAKALVILFVNYARTWENGKEKNFWTSLFERALDEPDFAQAKLYARLEEVLGSGRVFMTPAGKRSFYSTFLYHALAPRSSFEAFVRMLWHEFYLDPELMNGSYDPDDPLIPQMTRWLKNHFAVQSDDLEHDFEISTSTYAIRSGIKYAFMQYSENEMTSLLHRLLRRIDDWYYNKTTEEEAGVIEKLVAETMPKITRLDAAENRRGRGCARSHALPDIFRINPVYRMDEDKGPILVVPEARVFDNQIDRVQVCLFLGSNSITAFNRFVVGQDLRRRLEKIEIELLPLLRNQQVKAGRELNLRLQITDGDQVIIDTNEMLYRSYLLFDGSSEAQRLMCSCGRAYTILSLDSELAADISRIQTGHAFQKDRHLCTVLYPKNGESIRTQHRMTVFTDGSAKSFAHLIGRKLPNVQLPYQDELCPVFDSLPQLQFTTAEDISRYGIYVNGCLRSSLKMCSVQNAANQWMIDIPDDGKTTVYDIIIQDMKAGHAVDQLVFGVASGFRILKPSGICYGRKRSFSVLHDEQITSLSLGRRGEPADFIGYRISVDVLRWRLDNGEWHMEEQCRPVWYTEAPLHNNVLLEIDRASLGDHTVRIMANETPVLLQNGKDGIFRLGDALTACKDNDCKISAVIDGNTELPILTAIKKARVIGFPELIVEDGILAFDARECFFGNVNLSPRFQIMLSNDENQYIVETGLVDRIKAPDGLSDGRYECNIFVKESFLATEWTREKDYETVVGNPLKHWFDDCTLTLMSTKSGERAEKIKLVGMRLFDITYDCEEMGLHIYHAKLSGVQKRPINVRFSWDGSSEYKPVIRLRSADDEQPLMLAVDAKRKTLTAQKPDPAKQMYRCNGIYTKLSEGDETNVQPC